MPVHEDQFEVDDLLQRAYSLERSTVVRSAIMGLLIAVIAISSGPACAAMVATGAAVASVAHPVRYETTPPEITIHDDKQEPHLVSI